MFPRFCFCVALPLLLGNGVLTAQANDSIYAGRSCDHRLKSLRMPILAELGDSALFHNLLASAADSKAHITTVSFRYKKDGSFDKVEISGARSKATADTLRRAARDSLRLPRMAAGPVSVQLALVNATHRLRLLAGAATCNPQRHTTAELDSRIEFIRHAYPDARVRKRVVVLFILEADGTASDVWLSRPSGFARVDTLTMHLFAVEQFRPAIFGSTPVAALVAQPFDF